MTSSTKRKHVVREMLEDFSLPNYDIGESIVKVIASPGSNLHEVMSESGLKYLASLPTKFRKNVWIKRGDYVIVQPIEEGEKVKAEISRILYPQHIKHIRQENHWPESFELKSNLYAKMQDCQITEVEDKDNSTTENNEKGDFEKVNEKLEELSDSEDDLSDIPPNTNHPVQYYEETSSEEESSDED